MSSKGVTMQVVRAQVHHRSQTTQAGRDGAVELVAIEVSGRSSQRLTMASQWGRFAQPQQRSQAAQAGRDGATQLVIAELTGTGAEALSIQQGRHRKGVTHSDCSAVRLPRLDGMVPVS